MKYEPEYFKVIYIKLYKNTKNISFIARMYRSKQHRYIGWNIVLLYKNRHRNRKYKR